MATFLQRAGWTAPDVEYLSLEEYRECVGEERFALETEGLTVEGL
jgi:hypothetical protein